MKQLWLWMLLSDLLKAEIVGSGGFRHRMCLKSMQNIKETFSVAFLFSHFFHSFHEPANFLFFGMEIVSTP